VFAGWALVDADVGVGLTRQSIHAGYAHFFPAQALGRFGAVGLKQTFKRKHGWLPPTVAEFIPQQCTAQAQLSIGSEEL
jgi:hypothetical protein